MKYVLSIIRAFLYLLLRIVGEGKPDPPAEAAPIPHATEPPAAVEPPTVYDLARQKHKELKREWDKGKEKEITLTEAFAAEGIVFYTLANIGDLSRIRQVQTQEYLNRVGFGITPAYLGQFERAAVDADKKGDTKRIISLHRELISRMKAAPVLLSLCELAAVSIFKHDENPYVFNMVAHTAKVKLMQTNDDLQLFFCEWGWAILAHTATMEAKRGDPTLMDKLEEWGITSQDDFQIFMEDELQHEKARQR